MITTKDILALPRDGKDWLRDVLGLTIVDSASMVNGLVDELNNGIENDIPSVVIVKRMLELLRKPSDNMRVAARLAQEKYDDHEVLPYNLAWEVMIDYVISEAENANR